MPGTADDALGVGAYAVSAILLGVFVFGIDEGETGLDRVELVASDTAIKDFLGPLVGIEFPTGLGVYQRNGKREIIGADDERGPLSVDLD